MSIRYYEQHAADFVAGTLTVDMTSLYDHFVPLLAPGARLLDAGCGSGRDCAHFLQLGFAVEALDASAAMVQHAQALTGLPVRCCRFTDYQATEPLDAIWACASLLHVPTDELTGVMAHLATQLKDGGLFYCSFKYGSGEVSREGRTFTNLDETGLQALLAPLPLHILETWQTGDVRPGREHERWLNAVLKKDS
ncbi:MAG: class I SAM-dependent methyltransferase [Aeromonadaceae bacterium]|nr:class I SAM-dependent methyltransferase [Aeromonadaceae bacterium]